MLLWVSLEEDLSCNTDAIVLPRLWSTITGPGVVSRRRSIEVCYGIYTRSERYYISAQQDAPEHEAWKIFTTKALKTREIVRSML